MNGTNKLLGAALVAALFGAAAGTAEAQDYKPFSINGRAGVAVPTGSIADVAETGGAFGFGLGYNLGRVELRGNVDFGSHDAADPEPGSDFSVNVNHFIASAGYHVIDPRGDSKLRLMLNLGAGALSFDVADDDEDAETYFAINAGAELGYEIARSFEIFLNLQGDIAFKDGDAMDLGTSSSSAWVWPLTAGLKLRI